MDQYKPIDCNLYDVYIRYIIEKRKVIITSLKDSSIKTNCTLTDIFTKNGIEYIELDKGETKRLDEIKIQLMIF